MQAILKWVDQSITWICSAVLYVTMTVIFFILTANVFLRYLAGSSLTWASELPELLFPWLIMSGVVIAAQHGSHIAVVLLTQKLGTMRQLVLKLSACVVIGLYSFLAWIAWPLKEIAADERTPILGVPGSVSVWCLILGFSCLAIVTICRFSAIGQDQIDIVD